MRPPREGMEGEGNVKEGAGGIAICRGLAVSDEPDESDKKATRDIRKTSRKQWGPRSQVSRRRCNQSHQMLQQRSDKEQKSAVLATGGPGDLCVCSPGTGSKDHRSYNCYPGCAHICMYAH